MLPCGRLFCRFDTSQIKKLGRKTGEHRHQSQATWTLLHQLCAHGVIEHLCASISSDVGMKSAPLSQTVVMGEWIDTCTALKSGPGSTKSQIYYIVLTLCREPGRETWPMVSPQEILVGWMNERVNFLTGGLQASLSFEAFLCELMWLEKSLWNSRIPKGLTGSMSWTTGLKKEKKNQGMMKCVLWTPSEKTKEEQTIIGFYCKQQGHSLDWLSCVPSRKSPKSPKQKSV